MLVSEPRWFASIKWSPVVLSVTQQEATVRSKTTMAAVKEVSVSLFMSELCFFMKQQQRFFLIKKKTCFCSSLNSFHSQMIWFVDLTGSSPEIDRRFIRQAFCLLLKIFWDYLLDNSSRRVTEEQGKKGPQVRFRTLVCGADVCA